MLQYVRSNPTLTGLRLEVLVLPPHLSHYYVTLEQYYLLTVKSIFNRLLVASGGTNNTEEDRVARIMDKGVKTYMYTPDKKYMIHSFLSTREAARKLGVHHSAIDKQLNGKVAVGHHFSTTIIPRAEIALQPINDLRDYVSLIKRPSSRK